MLEDEQRTTAALPDKARIDDWPIPELHCAGKLTETRARIGQSDAVNAGSWSKETLFQTVRIMALREMISGIVDSNVIEGRYTEATIGNVKSPRYRVNLATYRFDPQLDA